MTEIGCSSPPTLSASCPMGGFNLTNKLFSFQISRMTRVVSKISPKIRWRDLCIWLSCINAEIHTFANLKWYTYIQR
jgi:hypothetical protein